MVSRICSDSLSILPYVSGAIVGWMWAVAAGCRGVILAIHAAGTACTLLDSNGKTDPLPDPGPKLELD